MRQGFTRTKLKHSVDEKFFDIWTRQMAYLLGFTFADGSIQKRPESLTINWDLQKRDLEILKRIRKVLRCTYPITLRRNASYRLRISNRLFVEGAINRGLLPKKNVRNEIPKIPENLLNHFIRGYLDGDGWIVLRNGRDETDIGFASGNRQFLNMLNVTITRVLGIRLGKVRVKSKITPKNVTAITYQLEFYSSNAYKIAHWLYSDLQKEDLFLRRKYRKYLMVKNLYDFLNSGTSKVRIIQRKLNRPMKEILDELYKENRMDGVQIARNLGVHSSSVYRWLARTGVRYPVKRKITQYG